VSFYSIGVLDFLDPTGAGLVRLRERKLLAVGVQIPVPGFQRTFTRSIGNSLHRPWRVLHRRG